MISKSKNTLADYVNNLSVYTKDLLVAQTPAEFDQAFDNWLLHGISKLEANSKGFKGLNEDNLSYILAGFLTTGEIVVTREEYSNGHVDLTVKLVNSTSNWTKLGEAKIWRGNKYQTDGLGQLLNRYTTGRECRGFVISYVQISDIKNLFIDLRKHIDDTKPFDLDGLCKDHNIRWSFLSTHRHTSGELVEVCHVGCNLYAQ